MRAVFTVDLAHADDGFPSDQQIEEVMGKLGRGFKVLSAITPADIIALLNAQAERPSAGHSSTACEVQRAAGETSLMSTPLATYEERRGHYRELAQELFSEMPEVAAAEITAVIYTGYFQKEQTLFVLTRMNERELTFRLLHRELPRLQASTVRMLKDLLASDIAGHALRSDQVTVNIYERKFDHVIIEGRVITRPARETIRSDIRDSLLFVFPLLLFIPFSILLSHWDTAAPTLGNVWRGHLERLTTALVTTSLISLLGLFQTWVQIRQAKLIDWTVKTAKTG